MYVSRLFVEKLCLLDYFSNVEYQEGFMCNNKSIKDQRYVFKFKQSFINFVYKKAILNEQWVSQVTSNRDFSDTVISQSSFSININVNFKYFPENNRKCFN